MSEPRSPHAVWARALWLVLDTAERVGLVPPDLYAGLPFDAVTARRRRRVDWNDYCVVLERVEAAAGSPERFRHLVSTTAHPELRAMARAFVGPKTLLRFIHEVADPIVFPPVEIWTEDLGPDRVRVGHRLRLGARPCLAYFRARAAAIESVPRHLGLPPAEVDATLAPTEGLYDVALPAARALGRRAARDRLDRLMTRVVLGVEEDGTEVVAALGLVGKDDDSPLETRLETVARAHGLTRRQLEVLAQLGRGRTNKEIARTLGCAENTVEAHVTQLLRKVGVDSRSMLVARLWSDQ